MKDLQHLPDKHMITNPVTIARTSAEQLAIGGHLDSDNFNQYEHEELDRLRQLAAELNLFNQPYDASAERSLLVPTRSRQDQPIRLVEFATLEFEGEFDDYAIIKTLRSVGHGTIRALCLSFRGVVLKKGAERDSTPANTQLHVPVFAITSINTLR